MAPDPGQEHLRWIARFQLFLLPLGALTWLFRSRQAALVFFLAGLGSLAFWHLHRVIVRGMLTPSLRRRWFYALLGMTKLALIALLLRGIMACFPTEAVPLGTGVLLFVGGILLEALRLIIQPVRPGD